MSESAGPGGEKLDLFSFSNLPADWVPERDSQCVRFVHPFIAWLPNLPPISSSAARNAESSKIRSLVSSQIGATSHRLARRRYCH